LIFKLGISLEFNCKYYFISYEIRRMYFLGSLNGNCIVAINEIKFPKYEAKHNILDTNLTNFTIHCTVHSTDLW